MVPYKLTSLLGDCRTTVTGEFTFCCPFCIQRTGREDKGFHLYVNPTKKHRNVRGWFICHRCKARGPLSRLVGDKKVISAPVTAWSQFKDKLQGKFQEPKEEKQIALPKDYISIIKGSEAYQYLRKRNISNKQIDFYRIGFGVQDLRDLDKDERQYYAGSGRIIFPDFDSDGNCVYWVARTYKGHKIKYKNPTQSNARDKLYNLVNASKYQTCVIAEGVISAIACGYNGVATYGKDVTAKQVDMLVNASFKHYFIAHDGDARKDALSLADRLARRLCSVSLVCFDWGQDPASVADVRSRISGSLSLSTSNKLRFKLGC